ncbi:response regulator [Desulfurivibrio sp. C05AmB]|uniref:response regulator n=1 Tax=Desulfurivibrio sp. C05AmB TaxID=3374371 RepID=UPI00376F23AE
MNMQAGQTSTASLAVFSGDYCRGEEVVAALARESGFRLVDDRELTAAAVALSGLPEATIARAFSPRSSVFDKFTHEKKRSLVWLRLALAELLAEPRLLLAGKLVHLAPRGIHHLLKVCLIADLPYRVQVAMQAEGMEKKEARRRICASDVEKAHWTATLLGSDDPWNPDLYDILLPMATTDIDKAVALISEHLYQDALQPTDDSHQALADFQLAARCSEALVRAGHDGEVAARNGAITVAINKKVLMFHRLREEVQAVLGAIAGVSSVEVSVEAGSRPVDVYRKYDLGKPSKVLLVDDEREFVQTLSERLIFREVGTAVAYDGQSALEMVVDEDPDVLVLDLKMPGLDGIEVLRRVKKIRPEVEVIILTGHGSEEDRKTCMELGAFAYLHKPVDIDLLSGKLKEAHDRVRSRR